MIEFIPNHWGLSGIELEIMNSNPAYNILVHGKEVVSESDIKKEYEESQNLKTERYLVKDTGEWIGIMDFCPSNPNDLMPWIGLFVIHRLVQGNGLGKEVYHKFEEKQRKRNFTAVRLGVIEGNTFACEFWKSMGYIQYSEKKLNGKMIYCYHKDLIHEK